MYRSHFFDNGITRVLRRRGGTTALCALLLIVTFTFLKRQSAYLEDKLAFTNNATASDIPLSFRLRGKSPHTHHHKAPTWKDRPSDGSRDSPVDYIPPLAVNDDPTARKWTALESHTWHSNGLLSVNIKGPHPIYQLVERAETEWRKKHERSSRTLRQAVKEYKRRYNRPPPLGFDQWWKYVTEHDVQLPDEYDQIYDDLEPYWGIDPDHLQHAQHVREGQYDSWTIGKVSDDLPALVVNVSLPKKQTADYLKWGALPQLEIMNGLWKHVPPFRATFSPHDAPGERVDWVWKNAARDAAKRGVYLSEQDIPKRPHQGKEDGWAMMCPPDSPLHTDPPVRGEDSWAPAQHGKTFIHNHLASMDVCSHPRHLLLHGLFLSQGTASFTPQRFPVPIFCNSATLLHADIHAVPTFQADDFARTDLKWEEKDDDRLLWRGNPTGLRLAEAPGVNWRATHRVRLVNMTSGLQGADEIVHYLSPDSNPDTSVGVPAAAQRNKLNIAMMDTGFAGNVPNCHGAPCGIMASELGQAPRINQESAGKYKYVMDVDGNGWSARFRRLMSMHSVVFKSSVYPEWWSARVQPWVHYVPVQLDYSDLYDSLAFFSGDTAGAGAHDEMAKRIGLQGREWVEKYWRREDMVAYMFRLWLEYARVMSSDRKDMNFELPFES